MSDILVVDDDTAFNAMLCTMLRGAGHGTRSAPDGKVALALYRAEPSELVLIDIVMPEHEGIETIMDMRRFDPDVRIVAMSGGGFTNPAVNLDVARKLGARHTLRKPFTQEELLAAVSKVLGVL